MQLDKSLMMCKAVKEADEIAERAAELKQFGVAAQCYGQAAKYPKHLQDFSDDQPLGMHEEQSLATNRNGCTKQ